MVTDYDSDDCGDESSMQIFMSGHGIKCHSKHDYGNKHQVSIVIVYAKNDADNRKNENCLC